MDNNEQYKELKNIILKNNISELKLYFKKNNIVSEDINNFNELLTYSVTCNSSFEIVNFILSRKINKNLNFHIGKYNEYKVPLFNAIANNNFKISNLLIKHKANINYKIFNDTVLDYLIKNNLLITDNSLKYILNNGFKKSNITLDLIFNLIKNQLNDILEIIYNFYQKINSNIILNVFLIRFYKNKIPLSNEQLDKVLSSIKTDIDVSEKMYEHANFYDNDDAIRVLFEHDESDEDELFKRVVKYHILEKAIKAKNYEFVRKAIVGKSYNYKYDAYRERIIKRSSLKEVIDNTILKSMKTSIKITELFIKIILTEMKNNNSNEEHKTSEYDHISNQNPMTCQIYNNGYNIQYLNYILNIAIKNDNYHFSKYLIENEYYSLSVSDINSPDIKGEYLIFNALNFSKKKIFKNLIKHGANCNMMDNNRCPLLLKAMEVKPSFIKYILYHPDINLKCKDNYENYPFLKAIQQNNLYLIMLLLKHSILTKTIIDINEANKLGMDSLYMAISKNDSIIVKLLIEYANEHHIILNVNGNNDNNKENSSFKEEVLYKLTYDKPDDTEKIIEMKKYPLQKAVSKNNTEIVQLLIDYSKTNHIVLNINLTNHKEKHIFEEAIINSNTKVFDLLINYAHDNAINLKFDENKWVNLLIIASVRNEHQIIELMFNYWIQHQININIDKILNHDSGPALEVAARFNAFESVKLILNYAQKKGILLDIDKFHNYESNTFLMVLWSGNLEIAKLIMKYADDTHRYINFNAKDEYNNNLFLEAVHQNSTEMVKLILDYVNNHCLLLDINAKDSMGNYPLLKAFYRGNVDVIKLIIKYANDHNILLDLTSRNSYGSSALTYGGNDEIRSLIHDYARTNNINEYHSSKKRRIYY